MKTKPHALESMQRGFGAGVVIAIVSMLVFGYLDDSEKSPVLLIGLPIIFILFFIYSILKFTNSRIKIRAIRAKQRAILLNMEEDSNTPKNENH